jgi:hypothetical protein
MPDQDLTIPDRRRRLRDRVAELALEVRDQVREACTLHMPASDGDAAHGRLTDWARLLTDVVP